MDEAEPGVLPEPALTRVLDGVFAEVRSGKLTPGALVDTDGREIHAFWGGGLVLQNRPAYQPEGPGELCVEVEP